MFYAALVLLPFVSLLAFVAWGRRLAARPQGPGHLGLMGLSLIVFVLTASVAFLALESYYRFAYDTTDSFALGKVTRRWFDRHYRYNRLGVRDDIDYALARTPGRRRVTFVGDSFTAGHGIADVSERFANLMRRERGQSLEVHILARNGGDTGAELADLQDGIAHGYQIDVVVLVYVLNDVSDLVPEWQQTLLRTYEAAEAESFFVRSSYAVNTWYYRFKVGRDPDLKSYYGFVRDVYAGPRWREQEERLKAFQAAVAAGGGKLLVVTFPFLQRLGPDYEYRPVHTQLVVFWQGLGVPHLDLLPVLEPHAGEGLTVNGYDAHPNVRAHRLAATAIEAFVDRELAKSGSR